MERTNNAVLAVFFIWILTMIGVELHRHEKPTHSGTQVVEMRHD